MEQNLSKQIQMRSLKSPLGDSIDSFLKHQHDLKPSTLNGYERSLRRFQHFLGDPPLSALGAHNVSAYASMKVKAGHRYLARGDAATIRVFSKWLVTARILAADPLDGLAIPRIPKKGRTAVPNRDIPTIISMASTTREGIRDRAIMLLAATHGLRANELRELEYPRDFDLRQNTITIREDTTKTESGQRTIPLGHEAIAAIDSYLKDERGIGPGALFQTFRGTKFSASGFSKVSRRLSLRLRGEGIADFKLHRLRHSWATNFAHLPGVTVFDIQQLGGWKDVNSAKRYIGARSIEELRRLPVVSYGRA